MASIKIVTDSTVDLSSEMVNKFQIEVVPLTISIDNKVYIDKVDITPIEFMKKMKKSIELPKSSQPSTGTFLEVYDRLGKDGSEIISIHMTGKMSGTVQSAESASRMTKSQVTVIDSKFISKAMSFQVIEAAKMAQSGKKVSEIVERLQIIRQNTSLYIVVDTLENLVKGGRIGRGKALVGSLLNIKPIASLEDAQYTPIAKVRSHSQAVKFLAKKFTEDIIHKQVKSIGIVHADGCEFALKVKKAISELAGNFEIEIENTTPVISTHTGPGTVALMYFCE